MLRGYQEKSEGCRQLAAALCLALFLSGIACAEAVTGVGRGEFSYEYKTTAKVRNVKVHYYAPKSLARSSRIVFVMHGAGRNGAAYRDEWQKHANKYNFLVICPELSKADFPHYVYQCGNVYDMEKKRYNPKDQWTFNLIEQLFDFIRDDRQMIVGSYCIFGHSAGAQFVHRMVVYMPEARFSLAIANGAGWYTLPDYRRPFYSGLKGSPITEEGLKKSFEKSLIVLMGEKDFMSETRPASYGKTTHKWDRVWRSEFFFEAAQRQSKELGVDLKWLYIKVPGADHNNPKHSLQASAYAARSATNIVRPDKQQ